MSVCTDLSDKMHMQDQRNVNILIQKQELNKCNITNVSMHRSK
jgi:hypothetical protein